MKVSELIVELQQIDQTLDVIVCTGPSEDFGIASILRYGHIPGKVLIEVEPLDEITPFKFGGETT